MAGSAGRAERPAVGERRHWVIYDDGSTGCLTVTGGETPPLARPGRFVSEDEYQLRYEELRGVHDEYVDGLNFEDEARAQGDYWALTAVGIPEETARRLSGYTGEDGGAAGGKP